MLLSEAVRQIGNLSDESPSEQEVVDWINDALAEIGRKVKAVYPDLTIADMSAELPIDSQATRLLVIPFATARTKQKEGSQYEYRDLYAQFLSNLDDFATEYIVPDAYKKDSANASTTSDIYTTPPYPFWRW